MASFKIAIIADIHGILPSLRAVLADIESDPPDEIIVAGDFLGGPQPQDVFDVLHGLGCKFILGNGELNLLKMSQGTAPDEWWTHHQFDLGRWIYRQLNDSVFTFLTELPLQYVLHPTNCSPVRIVHGAPWDVYKLVFPREEPDVLLRALRMIQEEVLVFAHNHLPDVIYLDGKLAVNPGSVSNNLNGDTRASYATLTYQRGGWQPQLHYVDYDLDAVVDVF
jgi:predicted phosphodiesterase